MCIKCYEFIMEAQELLTQDFWERYHFEEKDWELAGAAARFLCGMVKIRAAVENRGDHAVCAVTLGGGYDELEDVVERSGNLFLAYCVECLGMEFLEQAYERINQAVHDEQGKWLGNYHFLEEMQEEPVCGACGITMKKGMLHPLKSVVYRAQYQRERTGSGHVCGSCEHISCPFRKSSESREKAALQERQRERVKELFPYSYGVSHLMGDR